MAPYFSWLFPKHYTYQRGPGAEGIVTPTPGRQWAFSPLFETKRPRGFEPSREKSFLGGVARLPPSVNGLDKCGVLRGRGERTCSQQPGVSIACGSTVRLAGTHASPSLAPNAGPRGASCPRQSALLRARGC